MTEEEEGEEEEVENKERKRRSVVDGVDLDASRARSIARFP